MTFSTWLDGVVGGGIVETITYQVYDRASGTYVTRTFQNPNTLLDDVASVVCTGAAAVMCWAAWRYYQRSVSLRKYGRDMTALAGKADPVIGRDDEIDRVICILSRRTKNCAALVGAAGVGKTAIAEGLAQRIAAGTVPAALAGACIVEVDLGAMVAGTMFRCMFEQRIKNVIKLAEDADGKVILFIDEMHMLLGAGGGLAQKSTTDAANMLKPALARGRIRCVAATTLDEYHKYIEKDAALERRFQKVHVEEPSTQSTIAILRGLKERYKQHHGLEIQDAALVAATTLAARYITGRQFPDKAIDLIDEACATAEKKMMQIDKQEQQFSIALTSSAMKEAIVGPDQVAQVVSRWTGIPVTTLNQGEKDKLIHLAARLHERVVGQDEAVAGRRLLLALLLREVLVVVLLRFLVPPAPFLREVLLVVLLRFLEPPLRAVLGVAFR
ncbi:chaperone protein ClpB1-like [Aegilops tauschii subsp. strangulata]|uniref:chaperone protein ClpB1-like n=1 Tax=Aegilops tauschii subsp. strangulata TaxID=200361 RepID=UPI00098A6B1F|nr:putative chaperone protein ClpB2, chloroplastic [Aegilops tauschii subsp. strangulata]